MKPFDPHFCPLENRRSPLGILVRLIIMRPSTNAGSYNEESWREYRMAFQEFSRVARKVQLLTKQQNPDRAAIDAALLELERVRVAYNRRRDLLARELLASSAFVDESALGVSSVDPTARVKQIAELLWEFSGRPDGSADEDWHRAEEIVRQASAA